MSRVIGILGPSYCGSTLISMILDGLPGVKATGEDHHILTRKSILDLEGNGCKCGDHDCHVFPLSWLRERRANPKDWWDEWSDRTDAEVLVSSNKWHAKYDQLGIPDMGLILFRDPRRWITSWISRHQEFGVLEAAERWDASYRRTFAWAKEKRLPVVMQSFDRFVANPERELERLCTCLGLTIDMEALKHEKKPHHHIGGSKTLRPGIELMGAITSSEYHHDIEEITGDMFARLSRS